MKDLSNGIFVGRIAHYVWYKAYLSYLSVKEFEFVSLYQSLRILPIGQGF
jgi:hypothetical protein